MTSPAALLTFGIGPVHEFISSARRVADVWAGSSLLSHLMGAAVTTMQASGGEAIFPAVDSADELTGIPNRVVCRVPVDRVEEIAGAMAQTVEREWLRLAKSAVNVLGLYGIEPADPIWPKAPGPLHRSQTDRLFDIAWSWVAEERGGYAQASAAGAERYAASRLVRPFEQVAQDGEKCALCGSRTALPNGNRHDVRSAWEAAAERAEKSPVEGGDERFFRFDQGRLCLVCATKRLYTRTRERRVYFRALDSFDQPPEDEDAKGRPRPATSESDDERRRYVAVVAMDGDKMSEILAFGPDRIAGGKVEEFHREVSRALGAFASELRRKRTRDPLEKAQLDLDLLGITSSAPKRNRPQLIYAGGDDVLVVCAPSDALAVARAVRRSFLLRVEPLRKLLADPKDLDCLTLSGAIVYAHSKHPAGLLFREAQDLLKRKAKGEAGRNALAIRLMKRSGVPVEVAFKWDESAADLDAGSWLAAMDSLVGDLQEGALSSTQTFNLRREEEVLQEVFGASLDRWTPWLEDRLSRGEASAQEATTLARQIAPFFAHGKAEALRIVRFLGVEGKP